MVSTITPANASQDLLEIAVRLVRLLVIINKLYVFFLLFFVSFFDYRLFLSFIFFCLFIYFYLNCFRIFRG